MTISDPPRPSGPAEPPRVPERPPAAEQVVVRAALNLMTEYVALLADTGVSHGLIGPREAPRLWERHILGCAAFADLIPEGVGVADVGSGAGLPGVVLAIARPDLHATLVEPLGRRVSWLQTTISSLRLDNVEVHHGRAESLWGRRSFAVVTARAVAPIGKLAGWCVPLLAPGGRVLAMKGASAQDELDRDAAQLSAVGVVSVGVSQHGGDVLEVPTTVVTLTVGANGPPPLSAAQRRVAASVSRPQ